MGSGVNACQDSNQVYVFIFWHDHGKKCNAMQVISRENRDGRSFITELMKTTIYIGN